MSKKGSFGRFVGRTHVTTDVIVNGGEVRYRYRSVAAVTPYRNAEGLNNPINADEHRRIKGLARRVK